ncbi:hypothetical protein GCM10029964_088580 [Kibdelosporangium lantanae]
MTTLSVLLFTVGLLCVTTGRSRALVAFVLVAALSMSGGTAVAAPGDTPSQGQLSDYGSAYQQAIALAEQLRIVRDALLKQEADALARVVSAKTPAERAQAAREAVAARTEREELERAISQAVASEQLDPMLVNAMDKLMPGARSVDKAFVLDALKINQAMSRYSQGNFGTPAQLRAAVDAAVQALDTELAPYLDQSGQLDQAKLTPAAQAEITRLQDNLKAAVERQNQYLTDLGTQADQLAKDARPRQAEVNHLAAKAGTDTFPLPSTPGGAPRSPTELLREIGARTPLPTALPDPAADLSSDPVVAERLGAEIARGNTVRKVGEWKLALSWSDVLARGATGLASKVASIITDQAKVNRTTTFVTYEITTPRGGRKLATFKLVDTSHSAASALNAFIPGLPKAETPSLPTVRLPHGVEYTITPISVGASPAASLFKQEGPVQRSTSATEQVITDPANEFTPVDTKPATYTMLPKPNAQGVTELVPASEGTRTPATLTGTGTAKMAVKIAYVPVQHGPSLAEATFTFYGEASAVAKLQESIFRARTPAQFLAAMRASGKHWLDPGAKVGVKIDVAAGLITPTVPGLPATGLKRSATAGAEIPVPAVANLIGKVIDQLTSLGRNPTQTKVTEVLNSITEAAANPPTAAAPPTAKATASQDQQDPAPARQQAPSRRHRSHPPGSTSPTTQRATRGSSPSDLGPPSRSPNPSPNWNRRCGP